MSRQELRSNYVNICKQYGLFTNGDCHQYEVAQSIAGCILDRDDFIIKRYFDLLCHVTWICSDTDYFTLRDIDDILKNIAK